MKRMMGLAGVVMMASVVAMGQQPQPAPVHDETAVTLKGSPDGQQHPWTTEQLLTSTVHEAWVLSGRNEDQFFEMVKELAAMSAQKRGLVLPETDAAGKKAGDLIKSEAKKDPDQLLYAVVDRAVVKTGKKGPAAAAVGAALP